MSALRVVGVNDDADFCTCCGRVGLKRVVWIADSDFPGSPSHYGTTCAGKVMGWKGTKTSMDNKAAQLAREYQEGVNAASRVVRILAGDVVRVGCSYALPEDAEAMGSLMEAARKSRAAEPTWMPRANTESEVTLNRFMTAAQERRNAKYPEFK